jgi:GTP-binding protein
VLTVAIVGRPNVGKSTLFNRLVGRRRALVAAAAGVTRDWREGEARLGGMHFRVLDTAGLLAAPEAAGAKRKGTGAGWRRALLAATREAVAAADVALLLVDGRAGLTPLDGELAGWLRRRRIPVIAVANKCEGGAGEGGRIEAFRLGFGEPLAVSAEHGDGLSDLREALLPFAAGEAAGEAAAGEGADDEAAAAETVALAVVGRPNVGKSTLVNRLLGRERMLTGPEPGTTRDAIPSELSFRGRRLRLVDTAGLRRKAKVGEKLESLAVGDALRALAFAHVAALVVDARRPLEAQDLEIARRVVEEGRALVVAANMWDLVADRPGALRALRARLDASLAQAKGLAVLPLSALTGEGLGPLLPAALAAFDAWNRRVPTARLNRWLKRAEAEHPPPVARGRRVRLRYAVQAKARPPTFAVFASRPDALPDAYARYLVNGLRRAFALEGVPIRLYFRKGENPYAKRGRAKPRPAPSRRPAGRRGRSGRRAPWPRPPGSRLT